MKKKILFSTIIGSIFATSLATIPFAINNNIVNNSNNNITNDNPRSFNDSSTIPTPREPISKERKIIDGIPYMLYIKKWVFVDGHLNAIPGKTRYEIKPEVEFNGKMYKTVAINYFEIINKNEIQELIFPNTLKYISLIDIQKCNKLTKIVFPNSVTEIDGRNSFINDNNSLQEIVFPNAMQNLILPKILNCPNLTSVKLPNSCSGDSIINQPFCLNCPKITSFDFPKYWKAIYEIHLDIKNVSLWNTTYWRYSSFASNINVKFNSENPISDQRILEFNRIMEQIESGTLIIPNIELKNRDFYNFKKLKKVIINDSTITSIPDACFAFSGLEAIWIPFNVEYSLATSFYSTPLKLIAIDNQSPLASQTNWYPSFLTEKTVNSKYTFLWRVWWTKAKSEVSVSSIPELKDKTVEEAKIQNLITPELIYKYQNLFFEGSLNITNAVQIKTKITKSAEREISLTITLAPNTWYDENGNLGTYEKEFDITLTEFNVLNFILNTVNWSFFGIDAVHLQDSDIIALFEKHLQTQQLFDDPQAVPINPIITIKSRNENEIVFNYNYNTIFNETITVSNLKLYNPLILNPEIFYNKLLLKTDNAIPDQELIRKILINEIKKHVDDLPLFIRIKLEEFSFFPDPDVSQNILTLRDIKAEDVKIAEDIQIPINKVRRVPIDLQKIYESIQNEVSKIPPKEWTKTNPKITNFITNIFNKLNFTFISLNEVSQQNNFGKLVFTLKAPQLGYKVLNETNENITLSTSSNSEIVFTINNLSFKKLLTRFKIKEINENNQSLFNEIFGIGKFFKEDWENKLSLNDLKKHICSNPDVWFENHIEENANHQNISIQIIKNQIVNNQIKLEITFKSYDDKNNLINKTQILTINFKQTPNINAINEFVKTEIDKSTENLTDKGVAEKVANIINSISDNLPDAFFPFDILNQKPKFYEASMFDVKIKNTEAVITLKAGINQYLKDFKITTKVVQSGWSKKDWVFILTIAAGGSLLLILLVIVIALAAKNKKIKKS